MEDFEVSTPRLKLRPQTVADAGAGHALNAHPEVRRFQNLPGPVSGAEWRAQYRVGEELWSRGQAYYLVIEPRAQSRYLGFVGIRFWNHPLKANLGYALSPIAWGQGYMTEAVGAAAYLAFEDCHAARVDAYVRVGNDGSRRVLEKCGFLLDGTLRANTQVDAVWHDDWFFTMTRADWLAADRPGAPVARRGRLGAPAPEAPRGRLAAPATEPESG